MIKDGEEGRFVSTFWLDQATNSFNLVKGMLEENIASVKSLRHSVSIRDTTIDGLYKLAEEKDARIELRNETIMELRKAIQEKTDALEEQSYTIKDLNRVIAEYRNLTGETK